jgi:hypothetical protein
MRESAVVLGRETGADTGPTGHLGHYRARDGSAGAPLLVDLDGPHAACVVGKRGYGKSYTLGVLAEALARARGVAPVVVDPMGVFATIAEGVAEGNTPVPATVVSNPSVSPESIDPRSWCAMLGLDPASGAGALVWQAAQTASTLDGMGAHVGTIDAPPADCRAAHNHLALAESWGVFDAGGLSATDLGRSELTVVDVSGLDAAPANAVVRGVAEALYRARVEEALTHLPWLLVDEAHAFFDGIARAALETILTRGRAPGVSLVAATQRPSAVPDVAISQSDLLVAHRLTAGADLDALERAQPTYMRGALGDRLPTDPGDVLVIDDTTETVHAARIRQRHTPHGGDDPSASALADGDHG